MLSAAKHLLYLIESKQHRSFALLRMTWYRAFFRSLLGMVATMPAAISTGGPCANCEAESNSPRAMGTLWGDSSNGIPTRDTIRIDAGRVRNKAPR